MAKRSSKWFARAVSADEMGAAKPRRGNGEMRMRVEGRKVMRSPERFPWNRGDEGEGGVECVLAYVLGRM